MSKAELRKSTKTDAGRPKPNIRRFYRRWPWFGILYFLPLLFLNRVITANHEDTPPQPAEVVFASGKLQLHGFLWKPHGEGPFPSVVWNHGSERRPGMHPSLAAFYTSHNYVFFEPHRRGHGRSPGEYFEDALAQAPASERGRRRVELHEVEVEDVVSAVNFLKSQSFVDAQRLAVSGCSFGGIQTLLVGERSLGIKALIPFAAAAKSWESNPALQERLKRAVDREKAPVFLLQAENDFNLAPTHELTKEAKRVRADFQSKVYPAVGKTHQEGHWTFCTEATNLWGDDVLAFLDAHMKATQ